MRFRTLTAVFLAGAGVLVAGCGSTGCVAEGDQISVTLRASSDLNDSGSGPQHVRFRAWALRNASQFRELCTSQPDSLVKSDPRELEESGLGKAFPAGSAWITPGSTQPLRLTVPADVTFTHVGVIVLYPTPQNLLVQLDCRDHPGYAYADPVHAVAVELNRNSVAPGGGGAQE